MYSVVGTIIYAQIDTQSGDDILHLQVNAIKEWCDRSKKSDREARILAVYSEICDDLQASRPQLRKALDHFRLDSDANLFVVWSINRLGARLSQIAPIVNELADIGKSFYALTTLEPVNQSTVDHFKHTHYQFLEGFFANSL
jgi:DNA invertase Pin-like site-specific DNA recombinase